MKPETTPKPSETFLNELLDHRLSTTSSVVTNSAARTTTTTTTYPSGAQTKGK
jgi:hypothetical protein